MGFSLRKRKKRFLSSYEKTKTQYGFVKSEDESVIIFSKSKKDGENKLSKTQVLKEFRIWLGGKNDKSTKASN